MMLRWCSAGSLCVLAMAAFGCGPAVETGEGSGDDESSSATGDPSTTATTSATTNATNATSATTSATDPSTTGPSTATDPSTSVTVSTDPSTITSTTVSTTDPTGGELPDGEMCQEDGECTSGHCFVLGILGGICGPCETEADCPGGGCTPPNPLAQPPTASACNDGGFGAACDSDEICQDDLQCVSVIDVPGVLSASTCSECAVDADCDAGQLCAPDIAIAALTGVYRCVATGTLANGQSCDYANSGDDSCVSGHCAIADVMGLLQLGVCSACEIDAQCMAPQVCEPPQVDLMAGLIPGGCF